MYSALAALRIAKSQYGYHEGRTAGHWDNNQKFSDQLPNFAWSDGQPWCATFVQWCLWQVGVEVPTGARSASCSASVAAYRKAGRFSEYPGVGWQIFFGPGGGTHTGLVRHWDERYVYTVEGNTNEDGSPEGNGVYYKRYERLSPYVHGYGIPFYKGEADTPDPRWDGEPMGR